MADYYTQIVVTPPIPLRCMTKFEDWLLRIIFKHDILTDGPEKYFYSRENICPLLTIDPYIVGIFKSELTAFENNFQNDNELVINDELFIKLFQQIMMRDKNLKRVDVISSYTCSSMRSDGFGGKKLIILKDSYCVIDTNSDVFIESADVIEKPPFPFAAQLREKAKSVSEAHEFLARAKSLRQSDNPEKRDDLYGYPKPEETLEYKAALYIESLESKLKENGVVAEWSGDEVKNGPLLLGRRISVDVPDDIDNESLKKIIDDFVARNGSQLDDYSSTIRMKTVDTPETKWPFLSDPKICRALGIAARVGFEKALHLSDEHLSDPNQFTRDDWTKVEEVILGLENTQ